MNLFIDTNVLLSFYHLTDEDLKELKKLIDEVAKGHFTLWITSQLKDELARNRHGKIKDALKEFNAPGWKGKPPTFLNDYDEFKSVRAALKEVGQLHKKLMEKAEADIRSNKLAADGVIAALFSKANCVESDSPIFSRAIERMRRGNPPGKSNVTIGDEINWECLLEGIQSGEDIHIVSGDGDFASALYPDVPHPFLVDEWKARKNAQVFTYPKLSSFFAVHAQNINLKIEAERKAAIQKLSDSGSFYTTHMTINQLSDFEDFTVSEFEDLIQIALQNGQVGWITTDEDVGSFYQKLWKELGEKLSEEAKEKYGQLIF